MRGVLCVFISCLAVCGQVVSGFSNGPTNLAALDPASAPVETNAYLETLEICWPAVVSPSGVPAAQYHVELETNGLALCGDYVVTTNSLVLTLPSTNEYRIVNILPVDVNGSQLFVNEDLSGLVVRPIPPTMVTISSTGPIGTLQNSQDLMNWTTIAMGLMETNLTYAIDRTQNNFWRCLPLQPLRIYAHY